MAKKKQKAQSLGFDALSSQVAQEYQKKGMSAQKAKEVGDAVAAKVGMKKLGKEKFLKKAQAARKKSK